MRAAGQGIRGWAWTIGLTVLAACGTDGVSPRSPNGDPEAVLDVPTTAEVDEEILLDATASEDEDGFIAEYRFSPGDSGEEWISADPVLPYRFETPGNFTVTLTVVDNRGGRDSVAATISVLGDEVPEGSGE